MPKKYTLERSRIPATSSNRIEKVKKGFLKGLSSTPKKSPEKSRSTTTTPRINPNFFFKSPPFISFLGSFQVTQPKEPSDNFMARRFEILWAPLHDHSSLQFAVSLPPKHHRTMCDSKKAGNIVSYNNRSSTDPPCKPNEHFINFACAHGIKP